MARVRQRSGAEPVARPYAVLYLEESLTDRRLETVGRVAGGVAFLLLSRFMLLGFVRSDAAPSAPATIAELLITVGLPAAGGILLMNSRLMRGKQLAARREQLRQQTFESEIQIISGIF